MIIESFGTGFNAELDKVTDATIQLARIVIPLFMLFHLFNAIVKFSSGSGNSANAWNRIFQVFILFLILTGYKEIMWGINSIMNNAALSLETKDSNTWHAVKKMLEAGDDTANGAWYQLIVKAISIKNIILGALMDGVSSVARVIVEIMSLVVSSLLIVFGPLAIMFECMPYFGEGNLKHWFNSFLSIKCWLITLAVLDRVLIIFLNLMQDHVNKIKDLNGFSFLTPNAIVVLIFIILYLMVPVLTRYYIQGQGGALASAMMSAGSTAISIAATAGTGGASMAGKLAAGGAMKGSK